MIARALGSAAMVGAVVWSVHAAGTEWQGAHSGQVRPHVAIARGEEDWQRLWSLLNAAPPVPLPADRLAAAVFLGSRPTGGYTVEILGLHEGRCVATIRYAERTPSAGTFVTQAFTTPFALALVPRTDLPLQFERTGDGAISVTMDEEARVRRSRAACDGEARPP